MPAARRTSILPRVTGLAALLLCCAALPAVRPAEAGAAPNIALGLYDDLYLGGDRGRWLDKTAEAGATSVRIPVRWKFIAPGKPRKPRDPNDADYRFGRVDSAVTEAHDRGLEVALALTTAPEWAEGPNPSPKLKQEGAWDPDPKAFGDFARAVAKRYPQVEIYEAWNEANYGLTHLAPQWRNRKPYGVELYRKLLNAMYDGVKAVDERNLVVGPSLGPFGTTPNGRRGSKRAIAGIRPLYFLRELFCLKHNKRMTPRKCPPAKRPRFDVLSHHPINAAGSPSAKAVHPDSVIGGDLGELTRTLRRAERAGNTFPPRAKRPVWVTEFWWQTDPPNRTLGVKPIKQARNIAEALYVFWRAKISRAYGFRIRDGNSDSTGLYNLAGKPKPALTAFRFPFVVDRRSRTKAFAWGKAPRGGTVTIEQRKGKRWRTIGKVRARQGRVFTRSLRIKGRAKLRASVGGERSLDWPLKRK